MEIAVRAVVMFFFLWGVTRAVGLSDADLFAAARQQGIRSLDEVELAALRRTAGSRSSPGTTPASGAPETGDP